MAFEESSENLEIDENLERSDDLDISDELSVDEESSGAAEDVIEELENIEIGLRNKKQDRQPDRHSLEVRRAIEDHQEKVRLKKELDYFLDDEFAEDDSLKS